MHTYDEAVKEGVNPAHDESLRDHHGHVPLHHVHHLVHSAGFGHRVGRRLALVFRVLQEVAALVRGNKVVLPGDKGALRNLIVVLANVHPAK